MKLIRTMLFFCIALAGSARSVRGQSALDGFDPNADGQVFVVAMQPDGKALIGGNFHVLSPNGIVIKRNCIARLNPDGSIDLSFNPVADNSVRAIAVQPDGKIIIGGDFSSLSPNSSAVVLRNRIARLNPDGTVDPTFDPNVNGQVRAIKLYFGSILIGGSFSKVGGATRVNMALLSSGGSVDSFNPSPNDTVNVFALDGFDVLVGGNFTKIGGATRNYIARLDPSGSVEAFDPNANAFVFALAMQPDGRLLVGGFFTTIGGASRGKIARLDPVNGAVDSFRPNANSDVYSIVLQADGRILVAGAFTAIGGRARTALARLEPTIGAAESYDAESNGQVAAVAVQPDGKVIAGGDFTNMGGRTRNRIARLEIDGRLDQTLNLSTVGNAVRATAVQTDGKILIGGTFSSVLGVARNNIARLNTDGTLDTAFNPNANNVVIAIAVQADGKILVGGFFSGIGGAARNFIARLDATGLADPFNPNANDVIESIAVQPDGKVLMGGNFTSIGGATRSSMARLDGTGLADSFNPAVTPATGGDIASMVLQANGKILIGGNFTGVGGQARTNIARLNEDGTLDTGFHADANQRVQSIAVQADGKILAGGSFTNIGGATRNFLARLDGVTGLADSFNPRPNNVVQSIAVQADGKILAGGLFTMIPLGGTRRNYIARFHPSGLLDSFDPNSDGPALNSIGVQADGKVLVGGQFTSIGGEARNLFARLSNDTAALQNLTVTQSAITWTRGGSSPLLMRTTFESSPDNVNFTFVGNGTASGPDWVLTGLNLPAEQSLVIRARGFYRTGQNNGSESALGSRRNKVISLLPVIEKITAKPKRIWPPNHKLVPVKVNAEASDDTDPNPKCKIISVTFVDPAKGDDDDENGKKIKPAFQITGDLTVNLRAGPKGRVYTITVQCTDASGHAATASTTVSVAHGEDDEHDD
jgi:uncharacterized delta-60 repeat protein